MTLEQREQRIAEVTSPDGVQRRWFYNQAWRMRIAPTKAEYAMADILTEGSFTYVQQAVLGRYIADFLLTGTGLVIEVDGSVHQWKAERDEKRSAHLNAAGFSAVGTSKIAASTGDGAPGDGPLDQLARPGVHIR